jgi:hypothetical protein
MKSHLVVHVVVLVPVQLLVLLLISQLSSLALALELPFCHDRRAILTVASSSSVTAIAAIATTSPDVAFAAETSSSSSLADRLMARDPSLLTNTLFNKPPSVLVYPPFMRKATWDVECQFAGYIFPSTSLSKQTLVSQPDIPGFQKCSIAAICDIGKQEPVRYTMPIFENGQEDRVTTLSQQINGHLGYRAVSQILYAPAKNPNRLSIDFVDYKTVNAERMELFCNARESQLVKQQLNNNNKQQIFYHSEHLRQVTFGGGNQVGIPRQVNSNYAHYWTWISATGDDNDNDDVDSPRVLKGNLLTAAYLDPQDPLFFQEPIKPVAVYSHVLKATRRV